ncbi:nucleotide sugar dehydrogenase [soil metagenome]
MNICVVALGKIGLTLAVQFARAGHQVIGADIDANTVGLINAGRVPFPGEAHLDEWLKEVVASRSLIATVETTQAVSTADVVVVVVPLGLDDEGRPEFRALDAATEAIGRGLKPNTLVSYETTLPVGSTRERFTPALATFAGLTPGKDLFVCHSPERVSSGRIFADLRRYPKLVGGIDEPSTARSIAFYESVLTFDPRPDLQYPNGVWDLGSAEAAELAKLAETTYRDINIAFANELATHCYSLDIDVYSVINAANSQPYSHVHQPGIAVGGHCIPVYPRFYLAGDPTAALPAAARAKNESMPTYAVHRLGRALGGLEGRRVAVLGATYRGGVKETALSGVFDVVAALLDGGAIPLVHDPMFTDDELAAMQLAPFHLGDPCDGAIVQTDHLEYSRLAPADLRGAKVIFDGRNIVASDRFVEVGVVVEHLGGSRKSRLKGQ